uniref:Beta-defensin n=1 Tax=Ursus maritimus TaxID=29073 RepID=A0A452SZH3_URSMA
MISVAFLNFLILSFLIKIFCGGQKSCWIIKGHCRKNCKSGEQVKNQHYQVCCVPDQKVPITSPTPIPNFQTDIIDIPVTSLTTPSFEISTDNKEDEKSDSKLET